ncbi:hypothetical protein Hanom_Chr10g00966481 [Helianthus anomalus]
MKIFLYLKNKIIPREEFHEPHSHHTIHNHKIDSSNLQTGQPRLNGSTSPWAQHESNFGFSMVRFFSPRPVLSITSKL